MEFSVYLVRSLIPVDDIAKMKFNKVTLEDAPLFTINDVISYSKNTHAIVLKKPAFEKFLAVRCGRPFAVCVGDSPVYLGVVWSQIRSSSVNGVVALAPYKQREENIVVILAGYPNSSYFDGKDPRYNRSVFDSFEKHHKLCE